MQGVNSSRINVWMQLEWMHKVVVSWACRCVLYQVILMLQKESGRPCGQMPLVFLIGILFASSTINHRISQSDPFDQTLPGQGHFYCIFFVCRVHFIFIWRMGGGGVIQKWCHVYTTYHCWGNGVRTRERLPWRLTTTTQKSSGGNRENIIRN